MTGAGLGLHLNPSTSLLYHSELGGTFFFFFAIRKFHLAMVMMHTFNPSS